MNELAKRKMTQARTDLVLDQPFFGALSVRLKLIEDPSCPTLWTNGESIGYNPSHINKLSVDEVMAEVCHEVLHCANGHPWRRDTREHKRWNYACDYAINPIVKDAGFIVKPDWLLDTQYANQSAEQIYSQLPEQKQGDGSSNGPGDFPGGEVRDAPSHDAEGRDKQTQQAEWKIATIQAAQAAKGRGKLPGSLEYLIEKLKRPAIDWKSALRKFVEQSAKNDYTWSQPSRRFLAQGLYLPQLKSEQIPPIVAYWDTSRSRDSTDYRTHCASEITSIIADVRPEKTIVIYGDTRVTNVEEFEPNEPVKFTPRGGGGTDFRPIFEYITKQSIEPACFIGLTDLDGGFPNDAPSYPCLFVTDNDIQAPFGETIKVEVN